MDFLKMYMELFDYSKSQRNDIERRMLFVKNMWERESMSIRRCIEKFDCSYCYIYYNEDKWDFTENNEEYYEKRLICGFVFKFNVVGGDCGIGITVQRNKVIFDMKNYVDGLGKDFLHSFVSSFLIDLSKVSDVRELEFSNVFDNGVKEWCESNNFELKIDFMNKPVDDNSVDMIMRR